MHFFSSKNVGTNGIVNQFALYFYTQTLAPKSWIAPKMLGLVLVMIFWISKNVVQNFPFVSFVCFILVLYELCISINLTTNFPSSFSIDSSYVTGWYYHFRIRPLATISIAPFCQNRSFYSGIPKLNNKWYNFVGIFLPDTAQFYTKISNFSLFLCFRFCKY